MFADTIRQLQFAGRTQEGSGFVPPTQRAYGHVISALRQLADEDMTVPDEAMIDDLREAQTHWHARTATEAISVAARTYADNIEQALTEAINEFPEWEQQAKIDNLRNLSHRMAQFWANLDRELIGLRNSDPGTSL